MHTCMLWTSVLMTAVLKEASKKSVTKTYQLTYQVTWHNHFKAAPGNSPSPSHSCWCCIRKSRITRMMLVILFCNTCVLTEGEAVRIVSEKGWLFLQGVWIGRQDWQAVEKSAGNVWLRVVEWEWGSDAHGRETGKFDRLNWLEIW